jgi:hypothetical protein
MGLHQDHFKPNMVNMSCDRFVQIENGEKFTVTDRKDNFERYSGETSLILNEGVKTDASLLRPTGEHVAIRGQLSEVSTHLIIRNI